MLQHDWRTDRRNPYARPFYYYKTNAQRRQSLPGVHSLGRFLSNPYQYDAKLSSNVPKYRQYATDMTTHRAGFDGPKTHQINIRKTYKTGVPLYVRPAHISKTGSLLDEPVSSGEQPVSSGEQSQSGNMKQGSFKIDDGAVKGI